MIQFFLAAIQILGMSSANAMVSDELVRAKQKQIAHELVQSYVLEEVLDVRILSERKNTAVVPKKKPPKIDTGISLPGLFISAEPASEEETITERDVIGEFVKFDTEVTLAIRGAVDPEELELFQKRLVEALKLPDNQSIKVVDSRFKIEKAMENVPIDFLESAYNFAFKQGNLIWVITIFTALIFGLLLLGRFIKKLGKSIENIELSVPQAKASNVGASAEQQRSNFGINETASLPEVEEPASDDESIEEFEIEAFCHQLISGYQQSKIGFRQILWRELASYSAQISLYELLSQSKKIPLAEKETATNILMETFAFETRVAPVNQSHYRLKKITLQNISTHLSSLKFQKPNEDLGRVIENIYPKHGDSIKDIVKVGIEKFFNLFYQLFPTETMKVLEGNSELTVKLGAELSQLVLTTGDSKVDGAQVDRFLQFLNSSEWKSQSAASNIVVNKKVLHLLYRMSDKHLEDIGIFNHPHFDQIDGHLPRLNWIDVEDSQKLKDFVQTLTPQQAEYLQKNFRAFENLLQKLDPRSQFRLNEKISKAAIESEELAWSTFRDNIKAHFSSPSILGEKNVA